MKNIKDLKENECIYIQTKKDWKKIVPKYSGCYILFDAHDDICYFPFADKLSPLDFAKSENYIIHDAKDFLEETFEAGEEVEVSDNGTNWFSALYIGKTKKGFYVTEDIQGLVSTWNYIIKINHDKKEAVETIKKLAQEHDINLKEI